MKFSCIKWYLIVHGLKSLSVQTLKTQDLAEVSWQNNVYNAKFNVNIRLEHAYPIEWPYVHWL